MGTPVATREELGELEDEDLGLILMIRLFEQAVLRLFGEGKIAGTTHTCLGQEYIPVAVTPLLGLAFIVSNHRGHGHYLARFSDPLGLLTEITGRCGGISGGCGGSQHLYRAGFCSTGIQGEGVSVATGLALHMKIADEPEIAVAYIGDGTWGQGVVYESLNMAQLWKLPLVLLVENNQIAQSTPVAKVMAGSIKARAAAFGVRYQEVTATCPLAIRAQVRDAIDDTRAGAGPLVIEFQTYRLGPHSKGDDPRDPDELAAIQEWDWCRRYKNIYADQFERVMRTQSEFIDGVVAEAMARPLISQETVR